MVANANNKLGIIRNTFHDSSKDNFIVYIICVFNIIIL